MKHLLFRVLRFFFFFFFWNAFATIQYAKLWTRFRFFLKKTFFLYFRKNETLIFWEMEFSSPKLKKLLIFQEEIFWTWKMKKTYFEKNPYIFSKKVLLPFQPLPEIFLWKKILIFFLKITTLKKFLIFSQKKFFLYFRKWNFLAKSLKNFYIFFPNNFFLYFWREISELKKLKKSNRKIFLNIFLLFSKKNSYT